MGSRKSYVLDSSVFIQGFTEFGGARCVTSRLVVDEVLSGEVLKSMVRSMVEREAIRVSRPTLTSLNQAKEAAQETGDMKKLSEADLDVIALALDERKRGFEPLIVTDDYSVQNVASRLRLPTTGAALPGIRKQLFWTWYCPACFKTYERVEGDVCAACGTRLKRKPRPARDDCSGHP